jgi:hypothetical protein
MYIGFLGYLKANLRASTVTPNSSYGLDASFIMYLLKLLTLAPQKISILVS